MPHVRGTGEFKVDFVCIKLGLANGQPMRALVISVAEIGSPTHLMAGLVLENGTTQQMPIRRDVFLAAQVADEKVCLVEAAGSDGPMSIFGSNGKVLRWDRD